MRLFGVFSLLLLLLTTMFALSNPSPVSVRFLAWQVQTSLALALIGGLVVGGFLVFVSGMAGQRHLRARLRDVQARLRDAEAKLAESRPSEIRQGTAGPPVIDPRPPVIDPRPPAAGPRPGERP
jgi:putative membrane protein